jgi:hypothetical protein
MKRQHSPPSSIKCALHENQKGLSMLQKRVKRSGSFTDYEHKEEAQKFCGKSDSHEKQKKVYTAFGNVHKQIKTCKIEEKETDKKWTGSCKD